MFYHPAQPVSQLRPVQNLYSSISTVNEHMQSHGRDLDLWPAHAQEEAARLLRVNWIYQQLDQEPVRKPVLIHEHDDQWIVDCGDTRIMALKLWSRAPSVAVIITVTSDLAHKYQGWSEILSDQDLVSQLKFDPDNYQIFYTPTDPGCNHAVSWFEIGDPSTGHHLHDVGQRLTMMQHYLDLQHTQFHFSVAWCTESINWLNHQ